MLKFEDEFYGESDRACAIVAVAYLDAELEKRLKAGGIKKADNLTLNQKVEKALAAGLIGPRQKKHLNHMRKVRNVFAHQGRAATFDQAGEDVDREIDGLAEFLKGWPGAEKATLRERFELAYAMLRMSLEYGPDEWEHAS